VSRKGRPIFQPYEDYARANAQLRRKMLKFNINVILKIEKLQTAITREKKIKKSAKKKEKEK